MNKVILEFLHLLELLHSIQLNLVGYNLVTRNEHIPISYRNAVCIHTAYEINLKNNAGLQYSFILTT